MAIKGDRSSLLLFFTIIHQYENWFSIISISKTQHVLGRPVEANEHQIKALVEAHRRITTREIVKKLSLHN